MTWVLVINRRGTPVGHLRLACKFFKGNFIVLPVSRGVLKLPIFSTAAGPAVRTSWKDRERLRRAGWFSEPPAGSKAGAALGERLDHWRHADEPKRQALGYRADMDLKRHVAKTCMPKRERVCWRARAMTPAGSLMSRSRERPARNYIEISEFIENG